MWESKQIINLNQSDMAIYRNRGCASVVLIFIIMGTGIVAGIVGLLSYII